MDDDWWSAPLAPGETECDRVIRRYEAMGMTFEPPNEVKRRLRELWLMRQMDLFAGTPWQPISPP